MYRFTISTNLDLAKNPVDEHIDKIVLTMAENHKQDIYNKLKVINIRFKDILLNLENKLNDKISEYNKKDNYKKLILRNTGFLKVYTIIADCIYILEIQGL